jgi:co-chaperonin GroES (HSP10)
MIQLLGDRILVALPPQPDEVQSEGGIILARDPDILRTPTKGIVLALGRKSNTCDLDEARSEVHTWFVEASQDEVEPMMPLSHTGDQIDRLLMKLKPAPFDVAVGDCVLFLPSAGSVIEEHDVQYAVLHEHEIIGIVESKKVA